MKKFLWIPFIALLMMLGVGAVAENAEEEYTLTYSDASQTVVTGYTVNSGGSSSVPVFLSLVIPDQVTEIADGAFQDQLVNSLQLNEGLKKIGQNAFRNCHNLRSVVFPSTLEQIGRFAFADNDQLQTIDLSSCDRLEASYAFSNCINLHHVYFKKSMSYLSSSYMFENCSTGDFYNLLVEMPETIEYLAFGNGMFSGCKGLKSITLPSSIGSHSSQMFENCSGLYEVTVPASITSLPYAMFKSCKGLVKVNAPGVSSVSGSFENCTELTEVILSCGSSLSLNLSGAAFANCSKLTTLRLQNAPIEASISLRNGSGAFEGCASLKKLNYPIDGNIPSRAFASSGLEEIIMTPDVMSIAEDAFADTPLKKIRGWNNSYASHYWQGLGEVTWETLDSPLEILITNVSGDTLTVKLSHKGDYSVCSHRVKAMITGPQQLGQSYYAATLPENTMSIRLPSAEVGKTYMIDFIAYKEWKDSKGNTQTCLIGSGNKEYTHQGDAPIGEVPNVLLTNAGTFLVNNLEAVYSKPANANAATLIIPATVTATDGTVCQVTGIANSACKGMKNLTTVTIGKHVKSIGKNAFASCTKLKTVKTASGVITIKDGAFSGCKALKTFPALGKLQTIGANAFKGCVKLAKFTLGAAVKSIGKNAFNGCKALKTITVKTTKLTSSNVKAGAFKGIYKKAAFKCPKAKLKEYKKLFVKKGAPKTCKFK